MVISKCFSEYYIQKLPLNLLDLIKNEYLKDEENPYADCITDAYRKLITVDNIVFEIEIWDINTEDCYNMTREEQV